VKIKELDKSIRFQSEIQSLEKVNPLFSRATLRAFYVGSNRNGSHITKESTENAIKTIYNIPIVGEYLEQADNFGDHGGSIEIKGDEVKYKSTTMPYGVIPESAKIYWENVTEENGLVNEYLVVDGAYLWTGRYEELNTLLEQPFGQSMEIEVQNGNFAVVDGVETFKIDEFLFSAFCILGIDKDGEGHVEPCFESASITAYSLDKEDFKKQFNQMVAELKFSLSQGGNEMTKKTEQETPVTSTLDMFTEAQYAEAIEMNIAFDATEEETDEPAIVPVTETDEDVETQETDEKVETIEDAEDTESEDPVDYEAEFNSLSTQHTSLQSEFATLQSQLSELQSYKRQREESDLKAKFEGKLSDEEFTQVFSEFKDESLEKVEEKLFALIGKKNFSIQKLNNNNTNKLKIVSRKDDEKSQSPYGDIFED
jgi:hypothetical protein